MMRLISAAMAGALAALLMLAVQLVWRLTGGAEGTVPSLPEVIVAAVARLTPLSVFGAATENFGSLAKKTLFVSVLIGIVAVGALAGTWAARIARRMRSGFGSHVAAGLLVALGLFLFTMLVVAPVAHLGTFGSDSRHATQLQLQLSITFVLFGLAWAWFAPMRQPVAAGGLSEGLPISRRAVVGGGARATLALIGVSVVGASARRLFEPATASGDPATSREAARKIAEAARQRPASLDATPSLVANPAALFAQLDASGDLSPVITSNADFYHVSKNISDPRVSADGWSLRVTGLVDQELTYTLDDLLARATTRKITTLCCISNQLNGDLIGTAEWQGFPLRSLLNEAGVKQEAVDIKLSAADDYADSIPVGRGMDPDTIIVVGMNGEPLPADHGFPARLIVPGIYGMKNLKWLREIELVDEDFQGYWQTRGWSDEARVNIWARIDNPGPGEALDPGPATIAGVAAAGDRGIFQVDVSLDDGETWGIATLEEAINPPLTWARWVLPFDAEPDAELNIRVRVTDGEGVTASKDRNPPLPDGATGWPSRRVRVESV
ncbi:MAG TPA: molybdopterin-dependent oxidoreductase [Thermomicrobiales bacterium]|nr:molybdopterin-dependent oxidoreductase [Thermomicrobiales bacterium]